ncbi:MAG: glycosyltransferase family 39 protein, partial [Anaerolineae bacterium]|nr:glycosyltransferase family 39 protein [Anaerolineae bacterium]
METKDSYSFPLYHRAGQMARPIIASRYWIVIVLIVAILLYAPFLFSGFFQDDYGFRLQFSPDIFEKGNVPAEVMRNGPLNLYGFSWDSSVRFRIGQDKGFTPWWASDQIKTNFFRPLSSLTLAFDYSLWPDTPLLMHIHSLLWFCLLILLTYQLYRSVSGSAVVAGISILLLVVDDVFTGPVGWISNRHAVIAIVFCVLCVWLYHQGVSKQKWSYIAGACGMYVLALLASEMGLVTFAYLFAYLLVLDRDKWLGRVKRIVPFVLITVVWRLVYTGLGYGASGTLLYIDPILNPVDFITQMLTRFPV